MKAKEIKKMMLARYKGEIIFYEKAFNDVKEREKRIRLLQDEIKMYFGIVKEYDFTVIV